MAEPSKSVAYHALLCGVAFYKNDSLKGCVNDVQAVKEYLEKQAHPSQIDLLTASNPIDPRGYRPMESSQLWPTYANIESRLDDITSRVKVGDFVLFHFSGHGTRIPPNSTNRHVGDVALILPEGRNGDAIRYLRGIELANMINKIIKGGAYVTLVLDCCYSGGVSREDEDPETIRYLNHDSEIDNAYPTALGNTDQPITGVFGSRDGSMLSNWLLDPDKYTILAACGPHETAGELKAEGGKCYGALSYLLLYALDQALSSLKTSREVYQKVRTTFRSRRPKQNPALYGNADLSFFGPVVAGSSGCFSITDHQAGGLMLEAGQAHGVCIGDLFTLIPYSSGSKSAISSSHLPITARVVRAHALSSTLELVDGAVKNASVRLRWIAKTHRRMFLQKYPVVASISRSDFTALQRITRDECSLSILDVDSKNQAYFHVIVDKHGDYLISDKFQKTIHGIPTLSRDAEGAIEQLYNILKHLAVFNHVKSIKNTSGSVDFSHCFKINIVTPSGDRYAADSTISVRHQSQVILELQNNSQQPLYFYIYNLAPGWNIEQVFRASHLVIPPAESGTFTGTARKKICMTVPEHFIASGLSESTDIIKVFVTGRLTSFDALVMPRITTSAKPEGDAYMQATSGQDDQESLEDWFAADFHICTGFP